MKQQPVTQTGVGNKQIAVNTNVTPCNFGVTVIAGGTVNYTVNRTYDDPAVGFTNWFPDANLTAQTASKESSYAFPVTGFQVVVNSGTGTATLQIVQAGIA